MTKARWGIVAAIVVVAVAFVALRGGRGGAKAGRLYVSNEESGNVTVIDLGTRAVVGTIPVGKRPRGIQVGPEGRFVYVALSGSPAAGPGKKDGTSGHGPASTPEDDDDAGADKSADGIGAIDVAQNKLVRTLVGGSDPEQFAIGLDGRTLYVANEDAAELSLVDVESNAVKKAVPVGKEPEGVTMSPDGKTVWVTSEADGRVFVVDTATAAIRASLDVGARPRAVAVARDGARAFVTLENAGSVAIVDAVALKVDRTVKLEGQNVRPMGVVLAPDGRTAYVSTGRGKRVVAIDVESGAQAWSVEVGDRPWGIAISAAGDLIYTANGPSNDVSVVDVGSRAVVARIPVGGRPWGVALGR